MRTKLRKMRWIYSIKNSPRHKKRGPNQGLFNYRY
nr:MAG TPA: hypothetical protein [Caudoviricetes sp.]